MDYYILYFNCYAELVEAQQLNGTLYRRSSFVLQQAQYGTQDGVVEGTQNGRVVVAAQDGGIKLLLKSATA